MVIWLGLAAAGVAQQAASPKKHTELAERDRLWQKAQTARDAEKWAEAFRLGRAVIDLEAKLLGPEHQELLSTWDFVGECAERAEDWAAAETARDAALRIAKAAYPAEDYHLTDARLARKHVNRLRDMTPAQRKRLRELEQENGRLVQLYQQGRYADATDLGKTVLADRERLLGPEHPDTALSLNSLAELYREQANYAAAEPLYQQALKIFEKTFGSEHPNTARSLNNLAILYYAQGNYAAAEPLYQRALKIHERALGPEHPDTALSLNNLAELYREQANYAAAEPLYRQALKIYEKTLGSEHPDTARSLNNLASLYQSQANYAAAEPLYQRALKIYERALGPEHPNTALSLNNLAELYRVQGNYAAAEPFYLRALKIWEKALGPEHPSTAMGLSNLAGLYQAQSNYAAAEPLYQRALKIREKALGPEHPSTAGSLNNLAKLYESQGNYAAAEPLYQRALKIYEKNLGPEHPLTATSLNNLAWLYQLHKNYAAAERLYQRALKIKEKALGPEHPSTATGLNNLAELYESQRNYAAAEPLHQRALKIREKVLGPEHPDTATSRHNLALLCWQNLDPTKARPLAEKSLAAMRDHLERTAAIQSEQQQLLMAKQGDINLSAWLTIGSRTRSPQDDWTLVIPWKGLVTARQTLLRRDLKDEPALAEYRQITQRLSRVAMAPPAYPSDPKQLPAWESRREQWRAEKKRLEEAHEQLEKELAKKSSAFAQSQARQQVTAQQIATELARQPRPTALIDLYPYWYWRQGDEKSEYRIAAFVARGDGRVARVNLGDSNTIETALTKWRATLGSGAEGKTAGMTLRERLWLPLEAELKGIEVVLISPNGQLAQLPWGALPGGKPGTYLIEERAFAVIPIPQFVPELTTTPAKHEAPPSLLLAGDIEYGSDPGDAPPPQLALREAAPRAGRVGQQFPKLVAARTEMLAVDDSFKQTNPDGRSSTLRGRGATEAKFREQAGQYAWLHVITHGYFAPPSVRSLLQSASPDLDRRNPAPAPAAAPAIGGIGAALEMKEGACVVASLVAAGAAEADGRLKVGDKLVAIARADGNWTPLAGKQLPDIVTLIRGPVGTQVRLKVRSQDQPDRDVEIALFRKGLPTPASAPPPSVHPGLLSGLAFAGVNHDPDDKKEDGIVTALDITGLDLRKVDTVVLSACETGLGEVAGGEGLLGLQRAFEVAGAKTCVASLWKVPDAATARLMQRFYENLWEKKLGKLEALREAQLWMLRDEGARSGLKFDEKETKASEPMPPFYWAAFVLSGDWR